MLYTFFNIILYIKINIFLLFFLFYVTIFLFESLKNKKYLKKYVSLQRTHQGEVPRLGGIIIYIFIILTNLVSIKSNLIFYICISSIPLLLISLKEDLFQNTSAYIRLIFMILSIMIFFILDKTRFPEINTYGMQLISNNYLVGILFFTFSILVIINGMNFVDGLNGLLSLNLLSQLVVLYFLSYIFRDNQFQIIFSLLIITIFVFLIFNFPSGKIFFGDLGAYFFAFMMSILIIKFFEKHNEIISWNAVLILFYPSFELLFSFTRKIFFLKKNPFLADPEHLHTLVYKLHLKSNKNLKNSNNLSTILLIFFWSSPIYVMLFYDNLFALIFTIIVLSVIYISTYVFIYKRIKSNED